MKKLTISETTARENWPHGLPDWVEENSRLYGGFLLNVATKDWRYILTIYDGKETTAYLTNHGFSAEPSDGCGPAINSIKGKTAQHRKCVREWFRDFCDTEVTFK